MKNIKVLIALAIVGVAINMVCGVGSSTVRMRSLINYWFPPEPSGPRPLILPSNCDVALSGYVLGKAYPQGEKASRAIRGDVIEKFTPTYQVPEGFHGINSIPANSRQSPSDSTRCGWSAAIFLGGKSS